MFAVASDEGYGEGMSTKPDNRRESDPNTDAARVVGKATQPADKRALPPTLESAWEAWSASIRNVDERGRTLLRAAFEAGAAAAKDLGRPTS